MSRKDRNLKWKIASGVLAVACLGTGIALAVSENNNANLRVSIENIYEKSFYDLVDNVNNTENRLAKALNATSPSMQEKFLEEVAVNARLASSSLNSLPYSEGQVQQSLAFINQVGGYTETLAKGLAEGKTLSSKDLATLEKVYDSMLYMKEKLGEMSSGMWEGYNIAKEAESFKDGENAFTKVLGKMKSADVDYPTMIYDGPFSDSVVSRAVKGLEEAEVSEEDAKANLLKIFTDIEDSSVEYGGEAKGRFETYNFSCKNVDGREYMYVQMTKKGGHLLTATSFRDLSDKAFDMENAKEVALNFCAKCGIESARVVWSDEIDGNAYLNIAPVESGWILYPDLVKVKVDLASGAVIGYEATSYYTNHTNRPHVKAAVSKEAVKGSVPKKFTVKEVRQALIPLEYNREVYTWEVRALSGADEYYFYFNAETGVEENILKVINTTNGNLLM